MFDIFTAISNKTRAIPDRHDHFNVTSELKIHLLEQVNSILHYLGVAVLAVFVLEVGFLLLFTFCVFLIYFHFCGPSYFLEIKKLLFLSVDMLEADWIWTKILSL